MDTAAGHVPEPALPDDADAIGAALSAMPDEHNGARGELMTSNERIELYHDEPLEGTPSIQVFSIEAGMPTEVTGELEALFRELEAAASNATRLAEAYGRDSCFTA